MKPLDGTRPSRFARAAALTAVALPVTALAAIGLLHTIRRPSTRTVSTDGDTGLDVRDPRFAYVLQLITGTALHRGHVVNLLLNGDATYPPMWDDLARAERSITVQNYYMKSGEVMDRLADILCERAGTGIPVHFLYDAIGSGTLPRSYHRALDEAGVQVSAMRPLHPWELHRAQHRSHARGVVVDGVVGYTGGFGFADKWCGDGRRPGEWRENNVRFTGPAVAQLQAAFTREWTESAGTLLTGEAYFPAARPESLDGAGAEPGALAGLLTSTPSIGSTAAMRFLALSFAAARRRLYVTTGYFVPTGTMIDLLVKAARRGADVRVLTAGPRTDVPVARFAGRHRYERLLAGGVRIWEYEPAMMHAKSWVVDGHLGTVGGLNIDNRSTALMDENSLVVLDDRFGQSLEAVFLDDLTRAREIRPEAFAGRPVWERAAETGASAVSRLL